MSTRRRWLAAGAAWPALACTGALRAQAKPPVVIGYLSGGRRDALGLLDAFTEGMAALGWKLGVQYVLEERHAEGQPERLPALAQELATIKPALIVASGSPSTGAANQAAPTTPVVLINGDPMFSGLVKDLARPGGMITGTSNMTAETSLKVIELLVETMPKLQRIGVLADSTVMSSNSVALNLIRGTAKRLRVEAVIAELAGPPDLDPAFVRFAKAKVQAVVVLPSAWFGAHLPAITRSALAQRWPVVGTYSNIPRLGGLFSYGANTEALARRSAYHVDRILKGAKPGDLAIEQPTTFNLVLNLKTAKALGITMPQSMMIRATEVIE